MLTKALSAQQFSFLLSKMNLINIHKRLHLEGEYQATEDQSKSEHKQEKQVNKHKKKKNNSSNEIEQNDK